MFLSISQQPDIVFLGLRINEPVTMLSDFLITGICLYSFYKLKETGSKTKFNAYMRSFFILMGLSTLWGGTFGHGFQYVFGFNARLPGWYIGMISIMFIERAAIENARRYIRPSLVKALLIINILELLLMVILTTVSMNFIFVEIHSAYGVLGVVFSFHLYTYLKSNERRSKLTLIGVFIIALAAFVFNYPVIIDQWFNNLDLAHVLMAIGSIYILKGSLIESGEKEGLKESIDLAQ